MAKILLVEDQEMNRDMLSRRLKKRGYEVAIAVDGAEGVEKARSDSPDLILMDMSLPVMDGFEFVMELRKVEAWRAIPIVVVTAKDLTDEDRRRLNGDVIGLIQKRGMDRESLLAQLSEQVATASRKPS